MTRTLIEILDKGIHFGNMLIEFENGVTELLVKCINLLYNYNKNLYNVDYPKEILAIKFFQESNKAGNDINAPARIMYDSKEYVKLALKEYLPCLPLTNADKYGRIAIVSEEIDLNKDMATMSLEIDIGKNTICFTNIGKAYSVYDFETKFDVRASRLSNITPLDVEYKSSIFTLKYFNMLDEFYQFIVENHEGFILPNGEVFVPNI